MSDIVKIKVSSFVRENKAKLATTILIQSIFDLYIYTLVFKQI